MKILTATFRIPGEGKKVVKSAWNNEDLQKGIDYSFSMYDQKYLHSIVYRKARSEDDKLLLDATKNHKR